jgi:uncharacterized protein
MAILIQEQLKRLLSMLTLPLSRSLRRSSWAKPRPGLESLVITILFVIGISACDTNGANPKMSDSYFSNKDVTLESAIVADDRGAIAQALAHGANVNARGTHDITPLMLAVDRLKLNAVIELLAHGANPNLKAADRNSAVSLAVENYSRSPEIMIAVIKGGGDPNMRRPDDDPVIMRFVNDCNCEFIRRMKTLGADLDIKTRSDDPIITSAGLRCDWDVVWCLLELGAKYDYESTSRQPLSKSLGHEFPSPDSPIYPYKKKVWQFLKDHGIAVRPWQE